MSDLGRASVGRMQARQSRTKGKHGGLTAKERKQRLELGRTAADNLVRGTIARNRRNQTTDSSN